MRIGNIKKQTITKLLTLLGFSSTAFVFAACYGALPNKYSEPEFADSIQYVFEGEDTLTVNDSVDRAAE